MKKTYVIILFILLMGQANSQTCTGQGFENYSTLFEGVAESNTQGYVQAKTWYWNPDESGIGMNMSIQRSKVGDTGYFGFGAFYTYKSDGSQAWYTIQGEFVPNPDVNQWRNQSSVFGESVSRSSTSNPEIRVARNGCHWGSEDVWMGKIEGVLYETSGGTVLGGEYRENEIFTYLPVTLIWKNPNVVEIYLDNESSPSHIMERMNFHGDLRNPDADYITNGVWHFNSVLYDIVPIGVSFGPGLLPSYVTSNLKFREFNPLEEFTDAPSWAIDRFKNFSEFSESKKFYISTKPLTHYVDMSHDTIEDNFVEGRFIRYELQAQLQYVLLSYDVETRTLSGHFVEGFDQSDPDVSKGLFDVTGDYKMKGYLPPEDQGRISMYMSACFHCGSTSDTSFRPETSTRSSWNLWKIPDLGENFARIPDFFNEDYNVELLDSEISQ